MSPEISSDSQSKNAAPPLGLNNQDEFFDLVSREEPLLPELLPYVTTTKGVKGKPGTRIPMLHHKFIINMFHDSTRSGWVNARYLQVQEKVAEAKRNKQWARFLLLHERPYRFEAYQEIAHLIEDPRLKAHLFRYVWTDSENIWQHLTTWKRMWKGIDPKLIMDAAERETLAAFPDRVKIYRGTRKGRRHGMSWTQDRDKAIWFANRLLRKHERPMLLSAKVPKTDILAYLDDREIEIVIFPETIKTYHRQLIEQRG
jgi:hypothetical protein